MNDPGRRRILLGGAMLAAAPAFVGTAAAQKAAAADPLASWNDGPTKNAITGFVSRATTKGSCRCCSGRHTDDKREWAYDRTSNTGKLDKALDEARKNRWTVEKKQTNRKSIYPFEGKKHEKA